jgi:hypothetical protein
MLSKFSEAGRLLWSNLVLFSAIILTVWLPGNLLVNLLAFHVYSEEEIVGIIRITFWIEGIFGPLYIGAMIHALSELKQGRSPSYFVAMGAGFRNWIGLFAARFVAGLIIFLGLIALIIPGIILMVRYALLDSVVVLERAGPSEARRRSAELTVGNRGQIFGAGLLFLIAFILLAVIIYLPLILVPAIDTMVINVAIDCVLDVTYAVIQIVMFLYYWQATQQGNETTESVAA